MRTAVRSLVAVLLVALAVPAGAFTARQFRAAPTGCEYQWNGCGWTLVDQNCPNGSCSEPGYAGKFVGQTVYKECDPNCGCGCNLAGCGCGGGVTPCARGQ